MLYVAVSERLHVSSKNVTTVELVIQQF